MHDDDKAASASRRRLLKGLGLAPAAAAVAPLRAASAKPAGDTIAPYAPSFFTPAEWAFVIAACDRLIPHDEHGPGALELGVPEFLDRHMQTPYASGAIWYLQGPFLDAPASLGYQGRLSLRDALRAGIRETDAACAKRHGRRYAELAPARQEAILHELEQGALPLEAVPAKTFFGMFLGEVRNGYFADPRYGGNKDMGSWKMLGYPGARADYADWVEVRDRPYPLPPVDLAGRRD